MTQPGDLAAWKQLREHSLLFKQPEFSLAAMFDQQAGRAEQYSLNMSAKGDGLLFDYSKNLLNQNTIELLTRLADECHLGDAIDAMFRGDKINNTEDRAALHIALRTSTDKDRDQLVAATLNKMENLVRAVHDKQWSGFSGNGITDVVNLGIGGSDLGPAMVAQALKPFAISGLKVHFVSNVDPAHLAEILPQLKAESTLFIVASKSFTTLETHCNAESAKAWMLAEGAKEADLGKHFVAVTTNITAAKSFGISEDNIFPMWDWVGGRYSLWSAIGLSIALAIGMDGFRSLLAGASKTDEHFRSQDFSKNIPVLMALIAVWYQGFFEARSQAVIPYSQQLNLFPAYLQQLCMESLGKSVDLNGDSLEIDSGEIVWGAAGTNGQHSFFQLLHQGTQFIPVDFIAFAKNHYAGEAHQHLLANCLSQSMALMQGKDLSEVRQELRNSGASDAQVERLAAHKVMTGNRPSNTFLAPQLSPESLGSLIALYEHKVYVQSVIWNLNAFDQWGVELGKSLSRLVHAALLSEQMISQLDPSTSHLINQLKQWK